jgi:hypothetical protein
MNEMDEKYVQVFYNPKFMGIEVKWKAYANDDEYKKALNFAYELIIQKNCKKWLSDMTDGKAVSNEVNNWVKSVFIPKAVAKGIKRAAFIVPKDIFRKIYADSVRSTIEQLGAELKYFDNRLSAETWLKGI